MSASVSLWADLGSCLRGCLSWRIFIATLRLAVQFNRHDRGSCIPGMDELHRACNVLAAALPGQATWCALLFGDAPRSLASAVLEAAHMEACF